MNERWSIWGTVHRRRNEQIPQLGKAHPLLRGKHPARTTASRKKPNPRYSRAFSVLQHRSLLSNPSPLSLISVVCVVGVLFFGTWRKQSNDEKSGGKSLERGLTQTEKLEDEEDVTGHQYVCCVHAGLVYRNSPKVTDVNEDNRRIKFNEVVKPIMKQGDWICIVKDHWLPLTKFWVAKKQTEQNSDDDSDEGSSDGEDDVEQGDPLMKRYQADQEEVDFAKQRQAKLDAELAAMMGDDDSSAPPPMHKRPSWSLLDEAVRDTVLNDVLDSAATKFEKLKEKAAVRLQAAERGRQQRRNKKKKKGSHSSGRKDKKDKSDKKRSKKEKKDKKRKKKSES